MGLDDLMAGDDRAQGSEVKGAAEALRHLEEARTAALAEQTAAQTEHDRVSGHVRHLADVESRFTRRRDHFQAAAEANPSESRQATELAGTAERMRQGVERIRKNLRPSDEAASAQALKTAENITRIDGAMGRLKDAIRSLELVKLEEANREQVTALERASFDRLAQLGGGYGAPSATPAKAPAAVTQADIDHHVREVTRLAYEAEALAVLQRERLS